MVYCLHQPLIFEELTGDLCSSLPPSGQEKHTSPSYNELLNVITHAVDKLGLELDSESIQNQSKLIFFTSRAQAQSCRPLPFFQDLHQEVLKSWKQPFLVCITNPAATDFGSLQIGGAWLHSDGDRGRDSRGPSRTKFSSDLEVTCPTAVHLCRITG